MVSSVIQDSSYFPFYPLVCIRIVKEKMLVAQLYLFVTPWTSLPDSSVHGFLQARILERVAIPSPVDPPDPGIESGSPTSPSEPAGKPQDDGFSPAPLAQSLDDCCHSARRPQTTPKRLKR